MKSVRSWRAGAADVFCHLFVAHFLALSIVEATPLPEPPGGQDIEAFFAELDSLEDSRDNAALPPSKELFEQAFSGTRSGPARQSRRQPMGSLTGRVVFMAAGHGWTYDSDDTKGDIQWFVHRPNTHNVVEDYGNQFQMTLFADYCWNAGATIVPSRPLGFQTNEVVLDNEDAEFLPDAASWSTSRNYPYYSKSPVGTDDTIRYRFVAASVGSETALARYTPDIPQEGFYPVYAWALDGSDRINQLYRVNHLGGSTEVRINHRMVGKGWVWLGTYFFAGGTGGNVEISNLAETGETGNVVVADAIRFGNGMGDLDYGEGPSGYPREAESERYWLEISTGRNDSAQPSMRSVFDRLGSNHFWDSADASLRYSAYVNNADEGEFSDRIFINFHSNAGGSGGAVGLVSQVVESRTPNQLALADMLGREVNEDFQRIDTLVFPHLPEWPNRTVHAISGNFGGLSTYSLGQEMDGTVVEVAFHDRAVDAAYLNHAYGRRMIARSVSQAVIRFFHRFGAGPLDMPPDEPRNLRAMIASDDSGAIDLEWQAPLELLSTFPLTPGNVGGDSPTEYIVYTSPDGREFSVEAIVDAGSTNYGINGLALGESVYAYVSASNAGGESFPSNIAGARSLGDARKILIVDGFDRVDEHSPIDITISGDPTRTELGTFHIVDPRRINDYSYVVPVGNALSSAVSRSFDSAPNDAIIDGSVNVAEYDTIVWIAGEESIADETFNSTEQSLLSAFLAGGGNLFVSGAEIAWDLDREGAPTSPSESDRAFLNDILHAGFAGNDAATYEVQGKPGSIFDSIGPFTFDNGTNAYDTEAPDQLLSTGIGASSAMNYIGGNAGTAAITFNGSGGGGKVIYLGFPFETITSANTREEIMKRAFEFFGRSLTESSTLLIF